MTETPETDPEIIEVVEPADEVLDPLADHDPDDIDGDGVPDGDDEDDWHPAAVDE